MADATVATIAKKAGLSSGIVAHYFGDKDGLLNAAMRQILRELKDAVARYRADASDDPREQLRAIVDGNFDDSQINGTAMRVWLTFWYQHAPAGTGPAAARQRPAPVLQPVPPVQPPAAPPAARAWPPRPGRDDRRPVAARQPGRRPVQRRQVPAHRYGYIDFQLQAAAL